MPRSHHIVVADTAYHLATGDPHRIELIRLGSEGGILI